MAMMTILVVMRDVRLGCKVAHLVETTNRSTRWQSVNLEHMKHFLEQVQERDTKGMKALKVVQNDTVPSPARLLMRSLTKNLTVWSQRTLIRR